MPGTGLEVNDNLPSSDEEESDEEDEDIDIDSAPAPKQVVPAKYNTETTLKITISSGENMHDFELSSN